MNAKRELIQLNRNWKLILAINILLGISFWFGMFTDFEFSAPFINLLFPFLVLGIGLQTIAKLETPKKVLKNLLCLPSIVGGLPYIFFAVAVIVNPFAWSLADRITNRELVNSYVSPDDTRSAEVYILPGSNYEMETYNVEVKLRHKKIPFVVRHIYGDDNDFIFRKDEVENYKLNWINNDQLNVIYEGSTIIDRGKIILVDKMEFVVPVPLQFISLIFHPR